MLIRKTLAGLGSFLTLALMSAQARADWALNLPVGVTPISRQAYDLHMLILWVCVVIGAIVFGVMFWSIVYHRKSVGHEAAQFHHSTFAEIAWTLVPSIILVAMAVPATKALILMEDSSDADITIKVTAYQWKWRYQYVEAGIDMYSTLAASSRTVDDPYEVENYLLEVDNAIVLPVDKKVRLLVTSDDVLHAWWVPALGMKKDAVPGYINAIWIKIDTPGTYRGQCAELCGKDHGYMPIVVIAKDQAGYEAWVAEQAAAKQSARAEALREWSQQELMAKGESVYLSSCAGCHQVSGDGLADSFPAIKGSPIATGKLNTHLALVMQGRAGTAMNAFSPQLNDVELAAVVTYQRNALGNAVGDSVQPAMVTSLRQLATGG